MLHINDTTIQFNGAGLFTTDAEWIHPEKTERTYEIIYTVNGHIYIETEAHKHSLPPKSLLLLPPLKPHWGYRTSTGHTAFYWVHFFAENIEQLIEPGVICSHFSNTSLFKELLHYGSIPNQFPYIADIITAHILSEAACGYQANGPAHNKLTADVYEWVRINADNGLTVYKAAEHFGYNAEYISRLMKKYYGTTLKAIIDQFIMQKAKDLLANSDFKIKDIASILKFNSANAFVHFYTYHEKIPPNKYRNTYFQTHMNNR